METIKSILKNPLTYILLLASALRIPLIDYGLPLLLINDEPSAILGAFKMLELKSLIPAFHAQEFASVLYYPPYISYLYLLPFALIFGFQLLLYGVPLTELTQITASDLSIYFTAARLLSVAAGVFSILFIYKITATVMRSSAAAIFAAFFASTSLIHISLSTSARHWIFISLVYCAALYFLTKDKESASKRYFLFSITAALGVGISTLCALLFAILPLWYFIAEKGTLTSLKLLLNDKKVYGGVFLTAGLSLLPSLLYPLSNGFIVDITAQAVKSASKAIISPFQFLGLLGPSEPIFLIFVVFGFFFLYVKKRRLSFFLIAFIYFYSIVFYVMFRFESRFLLPIMPLLCIIAGFSTATLFERFKSNLVVKVIFVIILIVPAAASLKLASLALQNDSRVHALQWAAQHVSEIDKIIVYGSQLRLPATKEATDELRKADSKALRIIDKAEEYLDNKGVTNGRQFHSLNIYTIKDDDFLKNLPDYARKNGYTILIAEKGDSLMHAHVANIVSKNTELLATFGDNAVPHSIAVSEFRGSIKSLFKAKMLGPEVNIYRLK